MTNAELLKSEFDLVQTWIESTVETFTADAANVVQVAVANDSPSPTRPDLHVYATGTFASAWTRDQVDRFLWEISNAATKRGHDYAEYADGGYTTAGPGTSRAYRVRRMSGPYSAVTSLRLQVQLDRELQRRLDGAQSSEVR